MIANAVYPITWGHHVRPVATRDHVPVFCLQRKDGRPCWQKVTHVGVYNYERKTTYRKVTKRLGLCNEHTLEFIDRHHLKAIE